MTDNERISKWRGEVLAKTLPWRDGPCPDAIESMTVKNYNYDLSAWAPALYKVIEDEGLWETWLHRVCIEVTGRPMEDRLVISKVSNMMKATPAQKAFALARAIKEVGG